MKKKNKPPGTRVTRIVEGAEDTHFRSFFEGFYAKKSVEAQKQDMEKLAAEKREVVDELLNKLGKNYKVNVYLCKDDDPKGNEIPQDEHGHFYQGNVYVIDVQGDHRYCIQWFGPRTNQSDVAKYRNYVDILTDYTHASSEISRVTCQ